MPHLPGSVLGRSLEDLSGGRDPGRRSGKRRECWTPRSSSYLGPSNPRSDAVHDFLSGLRSTGFDGASMPVEIQPDGRERLVFIEGDVPVPPFSRWAQTDDGLGSIATLMRAFHDASSQVPVTTVSWSDELGRSCWRVDDLSQRRMSGERRIPRGTSHWTPRFRLCGAGSSDLRPCRLRSDVCAHRRRHQRQPTGFERAGSSCPTSARHGRLRLDAEGRHVLVEVLQRAMESGGVVSFNDG